MGFFGALGVFFFLQLFTGCFHPFSLSRAGNVAPDVPLLTRPQNPVAYTGHQPVITPQPHRRPAAQNGKNALWQEGAKAFFRDQRANSVGDLLTVLVQISDSGDMTNATTTSRSSGLNTGLSKAFGLESAITSTVRPTLPLNLKSNPTHASEGKTKRSEKLTFKVAALVTQILPNGNLVISGRQEVRVNFEVREILLAGIVRPEDILAHNVISQEKIAELRISYGGRGQMTDVQEPPYGQKILNRLMPF